MCGIAGFAGIGLPAEEATGRLRAMCDAIQHRGPDSDGYFVGDGIAMGMRRLSIIDVAGGSQPISNEDGTVTVVFNGEIYNHHELRRELTAAGHHFATRSDTEVLVHLYESHGPDMLRHLHGMFAFSLWDSRRRRLLLARDRTGMKPLSYALRGDGIIYGSELRALFAFDRSALQVAPGAVMEYLAFGYVPDPNSIFEEVSKLPAGHFLVWGPGRPVRVQRYWSAPLPDATPRDEPELLAELTGHGARTAQPAPDLCGDARQLLGSQHDERQNENDQQLGEIEHWVKSARRSSDRTSGVCRQTGLRSRRSRSAAATSGNSASGRSDWSSRGGCLGSRIAFLKPRTAAPRSEPAERSFLVPNTSSTTTRMISSSRNTMSTRSKSR